MTSKNPEKNVQVNSDFTTRFEDGSYQIRLDNILTTDQVLFPGMLLLKLEGKYFDVVKILEIQVEDGYLYLKIMGRKTGRVYTVSQLMGEEYYLWTLVSYDYAIDKIFFRWNQEGTEIEFDF